MRRRPSRARARAVTTATIVSWALMCDANPSFVQCDRTTRTSGGVSGGDVATRNTIMGRSVSTAATGVIDLASGSASTYNASTTVTFDLSALNVGAFVHASGGTVSGLGSVWTARTECATTSVHYTQSSGTTYGGVTWTAPSDVSTLPTVDIWVGSAGGNNQAVTRRKLTLTRDGNWNASPPSTPTCDASAVPTNGASVGDCTAALAAGATCQPVCASGYTVSGTSACGSSGVLTPATCTAAPDPTPGGGYGSYGSSSSAASRAVSRSASLVFATILGGALA
mmetsp:Transcript_7075/g.23632  ORF Transcript_7075/g.23632 Transcript_7075/m.23632 type:complete len:282 (-) Transcript_7075:713-1558(-)